MHLIPNFILFVDGLKHITEAAEVKAKEEKGKKKPSSSVRKAGSTSSVNELPGDTAQDEERIQEEEEDDMDRQRKDSKEEYVLLLLFGGGGCVLVTTITFPDLEPVRNHGCFFFWRGEGLSSNIIVSDLDQHTIYAMEPLAPLFLTSSYFVMVKQENIWKILLPFIT